MRPRQRAGDMSASSTLRDAPHTTSRASGARLWLDIETRLILRTRAPETDDAGQPIPGQFGTLEVTEIVFGEQPAVLFEAAGGRGSHD